MDVAQLLVVHAGRRVHHQIHRLLRLGEGDHVADAVAAGQQHHEAVGADGEAAVRRRAVFQRADQMAEAALDLGFGQTQDLEHPRLEGRIVDPDAAAAQLGAVEHDVVGLRAHLLGLGVEQRNVLRLRRGEGMVHADEAAFVVALEQREIGHPREPERVLRDRSSPARPPTGGCAPAPAAPCRPCPRRTGRDRRARCSARPAARPSRRR
jgi:hypothetical protein